MEFVQVDAKIEAEFFRDLRLELESPSGAVSVLSVPAQSCREEQFGEMVSYCAASGRFRYGSARHLGEDPAGEWTLRVSDELGGGSGARLESWSITVYGHTAAADAPMLDYVDPGEQSLTVSWQPPDDTGASAVTGYDVRHIRSDAPNKANDAAWTVLEGAAPATARQFTVTGLADGIRRDVQVRAVNRVAAGAWSATGRATPGTVNSEPLFPEGHQSTRTVAESTGAGVAIGAPVAARDAEGDVFTYALGGPDAALFSIDAASGLLRTAEPLDHETDASHRVTVSVHDGADAHGDAGTTVDASIDVTVIVSDDNEPPVVTGPTPVGYWENGADPVVAYYTAEDPEGAHLTWEVSGADHDAFTVFDGRLEFNDPPDFESRADADADNEYKVAVAVYDGVHRVSLYAPVTVADVNEPLELDCDDPGTVDEGHSGALALCRADDPENSTVVWSLSGPDRGDLTIDGSLALGQAWLDFVDPPDFDRPADSNRDNLYRVAVNAFDGETTATFDVSVTVADTDEDGAVSLWPRQPQAGSRLTAELDDPDGETGVAWLWERLDPLTGWTQITGATSGAYTPVAGDEGLLLRVAASYSDRHGPGKEAVAVADLAVRAAPVDNAAPQFPAGDDGMRGAPENAGARWPVAAQDPDGDPLTYRLSGADAASFEIDESSGLLASKASLDYETKSRYAVTVTAADPSLAQDTIRVTISVQNEDEAAALVLSAAQPALDTAVTATLTDADGGLSGWDWVWERSSNRFAPWTEILGAKSSIYTPVEADLGQYLRVTVTYNDGHGPDKTRPSRARPPGPRGRRSRSRHRHGHGHRHGHWHGHGHWHWHWHWHGHGHGYWHGCWHWPRSWSGRRRRA